MHQDACVLQITCKAHHMTCWCRSPRHRLQGIIVSLQYTPTSTLTSMIHIATAVCNWSSPFPLAPSIHEHQSLAIVRAPHLCSRLCLRRCALCNACARAHMHKRGRKDEHRAETAKMVLSLPILLRLRWRGREGGTSLQ